MKTAVAAIMKLVLSSLPLLLLLGSCNGAAGTSNTSTTPATNGTIIGGQGKYKYRFRPDLALLPPAEAGDDHDGHGLVLDGKTGGKEAMGVSSRRRRLFLLCALCFLLLFPLPCSAVVCPAPLTPSPSPFPPPPPDFFFTWVPKNVTSKTRALARFAADGSSAELLGVPGPSGLSAGTPHGIRIEHDSSGHDSLGYDTFLYHANNDQIVTKTTLAGEQIWQTNFSSWRTTHPEFWPIKPTDAIGEKRRVDPQ